MAKPPPSFSPLQPHMLTNLPIVVPLLQMLAVLPLQYYAQNEPLLLLWCSGDTNYTATSQFNRHLDLLLADLRDVPPTADRGHFYSASVGGPVDAAYGLAQCRGDVAAADCASCLNLSASEVVTRCRPRRAAAIRYDNCLLRYSDRPLLGTVGTYSNTIIVTTRKKYSDPIEGRLSELVTEVTSEAVRGSARFAVGIKDLSEFGEIYGLAQCTRDLSEESCNYCLGDLIRNLPRRSTGQLYGVSCILRVEAGPFFSFSVVRPSLQPAASPPTTTTTTTTTRKKNNNDSKIRDMVIILVVAAVAVLLSATIICLKRRRLVKRESNGVDEQPIEGGESIPFNFGTLRAATGNFSEANKLGEGGFGPVYKGVLPDGQQIAVKRLSRSSGQGLVELRNEVVLIAKLHHRNLVRLLGFCLEQEEKMVVYEYLPNKSLDKFLFDPVERLKLDWERRYKLIEGIARGLVYLHEDTRPVRIVHRDLKASNILLDEHMDPKISDFGLAKIFGDDETHGDTMRIAGTYGYMAPEYVMHGRHSAKSDVFSFGVLVLEIVTGRRNGGFVESESATDLLSYVWDRWSEGAALQLLDASVLGEGSSPGDGVVRCIHIGLLCVQEDPLDRPTMSAVRLMFHNTVTPPPLPSRPAFLRTTCLKRPRIDHGLRPRDSNSALFSKNENSSQNMAQRGVPSVNEMSMSVLQPR